MAPTIHLSDLQLEHPEYRVMASTVARTLQENGFALIQLAQVDTEKLETLQAILKEKAVEWSTGADEAVLQPSKQLPGRDIYEYSLGQEVYDLPVSLQKTTPGVPGVQILTDQHWIPLACQFSYACAVQAFGVLNNAAKVMLTALTKSPYLGTKSTVFDSVLDDPMLDPGQVSSSCLDAIYYESAGDANDVGGCQTHRDKGLLTILFADNQAGLQVTKQHSSWVTGNKATLWLSF